jgi:AraC family L-rhamnose operon transcriptional activator RhaR/AraC family L-rhamnose operon regulatory protein RhaS
MTLINESRREIREYSMAENMRNQYGDDPRFQIPLLIIAEPVLPDWQVLRHRDFLSLYFVMSGRGTHIVDDRRYAICRGDVYLLGIGATHRFVDCQDLAATTIHFSPALFDRETLEALLATPGFQSLFVEDSVPRNPDGEERGARWLHLGPDTLGSIAADLDEILQETNAPGPVRKVLVRALVLRLMIRVSRLYASYSASHGVPPSGRSLRENSVAAAVRFIDENFASELRVNEIAKMVSLSPDHFTEVFSAVMGRTPRDYIRHVRLEHAKASLRNSDIPITRIALECGWCDHAHLSQVFRAVVGLTPSQYRAQFHPAKPH